MTMEKPYTCITGASSGIGYQAAKAFADRGNHLILIARRKERLEQLKQEILATHPNLDILIFSVDLSESANCYHLYNQLKPYFICTWINNAGFGHYGSVAEQDLEKMEQMIHVNVEALTILSTLYVRDYQEKEGCQLINVSSRGGYMLVPRGVHYCASKFYVSAFTEGLALELQASQSPLQAKILAPAATKTEFGKVATDSENFDYGQFYPRYHSVQDMADFLLELYDSNQTLGLVDVDSFEFKLSGPLFKH